MLKPTLESFSSRNSRYRCILWDRGSWNRFRTPCVAGVPRAHRFENRFKLQKSADADAIDLHGGKDDHAAGIIGEQLHLQNAVGDIIFQSPAVRHAQFDFLVIHLGVLHGILDTFDDGEELMSMTSKHVLGDVIPPLHADPILPSVILPNAHPAQRFLHHIGAGNAMIQIVIGVGGAVPPVFGA